jgi:hypothetical protein
MARLSCCAFSSNVVSLAAASLLSRSVCSRRAAWSSARTISNSGSSAVTARAHNSRIRSSNRLSIERTVPEGTSRFAQRLMRVRYHTHCRWTVVIPYPVSPRVRGPGGIAFARRKARTPNEACGTGGRGARSEKIQRPSCRTQPVAPGERAAPADTSQSYRKTNSQVNSKCTITDLRGSLRFEFRSWGCLIFHLPDWVRLSNTRRDH